MSILRFENKIKNTTFLLFYIKGSYNEADKIQILSGMKEDNKKL